jgi:parallel beta-helix repeat protein
VSNARNRSGPEPNSAGSLITPRLCLVAAAVLGVIALVATHSASGAKNRVALKFHIASLRDHKRPTTPTGLSVTGSTATTISLAWSPSRDNVGVAGYRLYLNNVQVGTTSSTSYTLAGLTCGSSSTVGVSAYDRAGNTSPQATATTATNPCYDALPPSPPTGVTQTAASDTTATVSWTPSTDDVGVVGYGAYVGSLRVGQASQTTYTFTGLRCGQTTAVGLDAADAAGNRSAQTTFFVTSSACVDTQPPSAPSGVTETSATESTISLSWSASSDNVGVAYYKVYVNGATVGTTPQTSYSVSGLACGTSYTLAVEADDAAGNHSSKGSATLATSPCPAAPPAGPQPDTQPPTVPGGLTVQSSTQTSVTLSWNPATDNVGVAGYDAYQGGVRAGQTAQTNYTFTGLSCGTSATFGVDAYDAAGNRSAQASVIASTSSCPDTQAPTSPTGFTLTSRTTSSLSLTWAPSTDNVGIAGYGVYKAGTRVGTASSTNYTVTGLTCGTSYTIGVDAYDAAGNRSTQATTTMATSSCPDTQAPSAPTNPSPSGATQTSINLSWAPSSDNVGVAGYNVYANGTQVASTAETSYTVNNLTCGTSYTLAVEAYDGAGNRSPQASATASTSICAAPVSSCTGVSIDTSTDLVQAVSNNLAGTTFCIKTGVHRVSAPVLLKPGDRFIGEPGAVLDGSRLLTSWSQSGSYWVASGQTQNHYTSDDQCAGGSSRCKVRDDLFFDDKPLVAVTDISQLGPGKFFFDYPNDKIYIADNPAGHRLAADVSSHAFAGCYSGACGSSMLISGLIMEHFAGNAVDISDGTVSNNEVRFNHVAGIAVARDGVIRNNFVHDNGLEGLASTGDQPRRNLLVEGNETAHNGWYAGYNMGWEGGGGKWTTAVNKLTIRNNYSHDNNGNGFWVDTNNIYVTFEGNRIENNGGPGIEYEASFDATIRKNRIRRNGFRTGGPWMDGAGILIISSANVRVYRNVVALNHDGIGAMERGGRAIGPHGRPVLRNLHVHDNAIATAGRTGLIQLVGDNSYYTSKNNRFRRNSYQLGCQQRPFAWRNPGGSGDYGYLTPSQWKAVGNDKTSRLIRSKRCR